MSDGIKFDDEKIKMELLPFDSLLEVGKVLTHGAKKYAPHNWKLIKDPERYVGALMRHITAMECGERIDPDSGLTHISHIACNALFLVHFDLERQKKVDKNIEDLQKIGKELEEDSNLESKLVATSKQVSSSNEVTVDLNNILDSNKLVWAYSGGVWLSSSDGIEFQIRLKDSTYECYKDGEPKCFAFAYYLEAAQDACETKNNEYKQKYGFIKFENDIRYYEKNGYQYELIRLYAVGWRLAEILDGKEVRSKNFPYLKEAVDELSKWQRDISEGVISEAKSEVYTVENLTANSFTVNLENNKYKYQPLELIWIYNSSDLIKAKFGEDECKIYITPGHCTCYINEFEINSASDIYLLKEHCNKRVYDYLKEKNLEFYYDENYTGVVNGVEFKCFTDSDNYLHSTLVFKEKTVFIEPSNNIKFIIDQIADYIKENKEK